MITFTFVTLFGLFVLFGDSLDAIQVWLIFALYCLHKIIYSVYDWYRLKYRLTTDGIHIIDGVFTKIDVSIHFENIQEIELSASVLQRIFKQAKLTIRTNIIGDYSEFVLKMISPQEAEEIKSAFNDVKFASKNSYIKAFPDRLLLSKKQPIYYMNMRDIVLCSLSSLHFFLIFPFTISIIFGAGEYFDLQQFWQNSMENLNLEEVSMGIVLLLAISIFILALFYGFVWTYAKYKNYRVYNAEKYLTLTYGLMEKKEKHLFKKDVRFVQINRSPIMRLFKVGKINAAKAEDVSSDPDGERDVRNSTFPFVRQSDFDKFVAIFYTNIKPVRVRNIKKLTLLDKVEFTILLCAVLTVCGGAFFIFSPVIAAGLVGLSLFILFAILSARCSTFEIDNEANLCNIHKGYYSHKIYLTQNKSIERLIIRQNFLQAKFNLGHVHIFLRERPYRCIRLYHKGMHEIEELFMWWQGELAIDEKEGIGVTVCEK